MLRPSLFLFTPVDGPRKGRRQPLPKSEHTEAHYDMQEVEMGQVYTWHPESVVVECDCGERSTLTAPTTTCGGCGADHEAAARAGLDGGVRETRRRTPGAMRKIAKTTSCRTKRRRAPAYDPWNEQGLRNDQVV